MRVGPLDVACQKEISNRPLLLRPQVRGGEQVGYVARQYRALVRKRTADDVSKESGVVKTGEAQNLREQSARCLASARTATGI
jgi:hypothetical protein